MDILSSDDSLIDPDLGGILSHRSLRRAGDHDPRRFGSGAKLAGANISGDPVFASSYSHATTQAVFPDHARAHKDQNTDLRTGSC